MSDLKDEERILPLNKLMDVVGMVKKNQKIDQNGQQALMDIAESFIAQAIHQSCQLAKHRNSKVLEAKDASFFLQHEYGYSVGPRSNVPNKPAECDEHKVRVQMVRNAQQGI